MYSAPKEQCQNIYIHIFVYENCKELVILLMEFWVIYFNDKIQFLYASAVIGNEKLFFFIYIVSFSKIQNN